MKNESKFNVSNNSSREPRTYYPGDRVRLRSNGLPIRENWQSAKPQINGGDRCRVRVRQLYTLILLVFSSLDVAGIDQCSDLEANDSASTDVVVKSICLGLRHLCFSRHQGSRTYFAANSLHFDVLLVPGPSPPRPRSCPLRDMGHARLAFFSRLSLVFLLTLLALCSAAPAPAPDYTVTIFGIPITIHTPAVPTLPAGGGGSRKGGSGNGGNNNNGNGGGNNKGNGGGDNNNTPTTQKQAPTTSSKQQPPPTTPAQTSRQTPPTTSSPPPPPSTSSKTDTGSASSSSGAGQQLQVQASSKSSNSASSASSTLKSTSASGPTIPADLSSGTPSNPGVLPTDSGTLDPASTSSSVAAVSASSHSTPIAAIVIPIILVLALCAAAAVVYKRRRARAEETESPPMSQWLGGDGAWSRLDTSAARTTPPVPVSIPISPVPAVFAPSVQPLRASTSVSVVPAHALDITEFIGEAVSVQTLSTPPSSRAPSTVGYNPTDDGHPNNARVSYAYSTADTVGQPQSYGHDHGSLFAADSPFESSESPLHWQDEPALADSRPTSLEARGSTLLAYDVPVVFDPRNSQLV
ncbi:hypothetical protein K438DRAFT_410601 [Mycena galopus ATCC 62051]|nr:hypothetical protein K438DRAFT_410601 [Mycena galopus ATCC 62051]